MTGPKIEFTSEMAAKYSSMIRSTIPAYDDMHQMAVSILGCRTAEEARVLVVGAGDGQELLCLKKARPSWRLTGVDPSADMLHIARSRMATHGLEVDLHTGHLSKMPEMEPFDAATAILVMHFINGTEEKLSFLRDIALRLKPNAVYIHVDLCLEPGFHEAWNRYQIDKGRGEEELREHNIRRANSVFSVSPESTKQLFVEAGFSQVTTFYKAFNFQGWAMERKMER